MHRTRVTPALVLLTLALVAASRPTAYAQAAPPAFPLTLQQAVRYAVDNYPAIEASRARIAAQEAGVDLAGTSYLPRLDTSIQLNRATRNNVAGLLLPGLTIPSISGPVSDTTSASTIWGTAGGVLVSWEAFDFGLRDATVGVARAQVLRARAGADLTRLEVGVSAAEAFLRFAAARETVRAARAHVERQQVFADAVAVRVANQLRPGAEDSRARAELAGARIQLIQAEQAERVSRASLAQWLGVAASAVEIDTAGLLAGPPAPAPASAAVARHPLAETQQANVDASRAAQQALGRSFAPRVSVQAALAARGTGALAGSAAPGGTRGLNFGVPNWAAGVTATFPLFDWFAVRERTRVEAQNERAERAAYDRVVRELATRSEQASAELDGARRVAENTPIQLASARVLQEQSRARYDAGLADVVEVADAQRLLLQAEVADAMARLGVWRALVTDAAARGDLSELVR
jgi:outer membrane protein